jgi:hypothetical protein
MFQFLADREQIVLQHIPVGMGTGYSATSPNYVKYSTVGPMK